MGVDAERDVRVLVTGELLHDAWMNALLACEGQERVPQEISNLGFPADGHSPDLGRGGRFGMRVRHARLLPGQGLRPAADAPLWRPGAGWGFTFHAFTWKRRTRFAFPTFTFQI